MIWMPLPFLINPFDPDSFNNFLVFLCCVWRFFHSIPPKLGSENQEVILTTWFCVYGNCCTAWPTAHFTEFALQSGVVRFEPPYIKWQKLSFDSACAAVKISGSFWPTDFRRCFAGAECRTGCVSATKSGNGLQKTCNIVLSCSYTIFILFFDFSVAFVVREEKSLIDKGFSRG